MSPRSRGPRVANAGQGHLDPDDGRAPEYAVGCFAREARMPPNRDDDRLSTRRQQPLPRWLPIAGFAIGLLTLLFFMNLVIRGRSIPCDQRFLVVVVFAFGAAMASSFIGGWATAQGKLPLAVNRANVIGVSAGGGIAVLIILLVLGKTLYECKAEAVARRLTRVEVETFLQPNRGNIERCLARLPRKYFYLDFVFTEGDDNAVNVEIIPGQEAKPDTEFLHPSLRKRQVEGIDGHGALSFSSTATKLSVTAPDVNGCIVGTLRDELRRYSFAGWEAGFVHRYITDEIGRDQHARFSDLPRVPKTGEVEPTSSARSGEKPLGTSKTSSRLSAGGTATPRSAATRMEQQKPRKWDGASEIAVQRDSLSYVVAGNIASLVVRRHDSNQSGKYEFVSHINVFNQGTRDVVLESATGWLEVRGLLLGKAPRGLPIAPWRTPEAELKKHDWIVLGSYQYSLDEGERVVAQPLPAGQSRAIEIRAFFDPVPPPYSCFQDCPSFDDRMNLVAASDAKGGTSLLASDVGVLLRIATPNESGQECKLIAGQLQEGQPGRTWLPLPTNLMSDKDVGSMPMRDIHGRLVTGHCELH